MKPLQCAGILWMAVVSSAIVLLTCGAGWSGSGTVQRTKVTTFHPGIPGGPGKFGHCWTESIAVGRRGAWRCMSGNEIFDPCFEVPALRKAVVCDASPATNRPGFVMRLTKPLPTPSPDAEISRPWLLKLSDGSVCEIETGTIAQVNGEDVPYDCSDSHQCDDNGNCPYMTGLGFPLKPGKVWRAAKVTYSAANGAIKLLKREWIEVEVVWK